MRWIIDARIGLACFLGGLIGSSIPAGSWVTMTLGMMLGGVLAYVLYDPLKFGRSLKKAAETSFAVGPTLLNAVFWTILVEFCVAFYSFFVLFGLVDLVSTLSEADSSLVSFFDNTLMLLYFAAFAGTFAGLFVTYLLLRPSHKTIVVEGRKMAVEMRECFLKYVNPIAAMYWLVFGLTVGVIRGSKLCWQYLAWSLATIYLNRRAIYQFFIRAGKVFSLFTVLTVYYYHSREARVCLVDGALGAAIGCILGSALVGGVIGAMLGILNYELLSVRILKIAPPKLSLTK